MTWQAKLCDEARLLNLKGIMKGACKCFSPAVLHEPCPHYSPTLHSEAVRRAKILILGDCQCCKKDLPAKNLDN